MYNYEVWCVCTLLKQLPSHIPGHSCLPKGQASTEQFDEKRGDFFSAWGGISSVGMGLPILWTEMSRRRLTGDDKAIMDVAKWCCVNTAKQVGLEQQKGQLAVGFDADICVFDDSAEWVVEPSTMLFRNKCSPYQGRTMRGQVQATLLRGQPIYVRNGDNNGFKVLLIYICG